MLSSQAVTAQHPVRVAGATRNFYLSFSACYSSTQVRLIYYPGAMELIKTCRVMLSNIISTITAKQFPGNNELLKRGRKMSCFLK